MTVVLRFPKVWEIVRRFKECCRSKGWEASTQEDWVKEENRYHNFLWIQKIHPSTFRKVATSCKCVIRTGLSYSVVDVNYLAWLLPKTPPEELRHMFAEEPELTTRNAIYDLSYPYEGMSTYLKLNKTKSIVFREFERFLEMEWGIKGEKFPVIT